MENKLIKIKKYNKILILMTIVLIIACFIIASNEMSRVVAINTYYIQAENNQDQIYLSNIQTEWEIFTTYEFDPNQYYSVKYPDNYPAKHFSPKFLKNNADDRKLIIYTDKINNIRFELPPTLENVDLKLINNFIKSFSQDDKESLKDRVYRITNLITKSDFIMIETAEVIGLRDKDIHYILPILSFNSYYLGIKNTRDESFEFYKNSTREFNEILSRLEVPEEDKQLKEDFILNE